MTMPFKSKINIMHFSPAPIIMLTLLPLELLAAIAFLLTARDQANLQRSCRLFWHVVPMFKRITDVWNEKALTAALRSAAQVGGCEELHTTKIQTTIAFLRAQRRYLTRLRSVLLTVSSGELNDAFFAEVRSLLPSLRSLVLDVCVDGGGVVAMEGAMPLHVRVNSVHLTTVSFETWSANLIRLAAAAPIGRLNVMLLQCAAERDADIADALHAAAAAGVRAEHVEFINTLYLSRPADENIVRTTVAALSAIAERDSTQLFEFCGGHAIIPRRPRRVTILEGHHTGVFSTLEKGVREPLERLVLRNELFTNDEDVRAISALLTDRVRDLVTLDSYPKWRIPMFANARDLRSIEIPMAVPEDVTTMLSEASAPSLERVTLFASGGFRRFNARWEALGRLLAERTRFPALRRVVTNAEDVARAFRTISQGWTVDVVDGPASHYPLPMRHSQGT